MTGGSVGLTRGLDREAGWCCSYCSAPLEVQAHGLYCAAERRWFASLDGVHRLLPEERRRQLGPFLLFELWSLHAYRLTKAITALLRIN